MVPRSVDTSPAVASRSRALVSSKTSAAVGKDPPDETLAIFARMELRLIVETDRPSDFEREGRTPL